MNGEINASTEGTESELGLGIKKINVYKHLYIQQKYSSVSLA